MRDIDYDKDDITKAIDDAVQKGLGLKTCRIETVRRNTSLKRISVDALFLMPSHREMVLVKLLGTYDEWKELESHAGRGLLYDHVARLFNKRTRLAIKNIFKERWSEFADEFHSIIEAAQDENPLEPLKWRKASSYPVGFKSTAKQLYIYIQIWKPTQFKEWPIFLKKCFKEYHIHPKGNPVDATLTILEHRYNLYLTPSGKVKGYSEIRRNQNFYRKYLLKTKSVKRRLANLSFPLPPLLAELFSPFCPCLNQYLHQSKVKTMSDLPV